MSIRRPSFLTFRRRKLTPLFWNMICFISQNFGHFNESNIKITIIMSSENCVNICWNTALHLKKCFEDRYEKQAHLRSQLVILTEQGHLPGGSPGFQRADSSARAFPLNSFSGRTTNPWGAREGSSSDYKNYRTPFCKRIPKNTSLHFFVRIDTAETSLPKF